MIRGRAPLGKSAVSASVRPQYERLLHHDPTRRTFPADHTSVFEQFAKFIGDSLEWNIYAVFTLIKLKTATDSRHEQAAT